jgi:feruloyl esterase
VELIIQQADESIPTKSSEHYYLAVSKEIPDVQSFYRYFEAPGLGHCSGGLGGQPLTTFDALRRWVEDGDVPETLPVNYNTTDGIKSSRMLCPYPAKAVYRGGSPSDARSFQCCGNNASSTMGGKKTHQRRVPN